MASKKFNLNEFMTYIAKKTKEAGYQVEVLLLKLYADYESYQYKVSTQLYVWEDGQLKAYEK